MKLTIRKENTTDYNSVYNLIKLAFASAEHSDGNEQDLVTRLRDSENFIPELSLVAEDTTAIVGHILFTQLEVRNDTDSFAGLALAPLAVLPSYQNKRVGSQLIEEGLRIAKELGYEFVIVLGSNEYYSRFGFQEAASYGIHAPFEVPSEFFMALELSPGALNRISGTVYYAKEFF